MILTCGTKCTAVIKSDPAPLLPGLPHLFPFSSLLLSINCRFIRALRDRENSEVVIPFPRLDGPSFFLFLSLRPYYSYLVSPPIRIVITLSYFFSVCSNNRVIPRVYRRLFRSDCSTTLDRSSSRAIFFPFSARLARARDNRPNGLVQRPLSHELGIR